tara:strand:- start:3361 stop:4521 length:1161 start_codon:yes stop_codon:yes gene_type:complete
MTSATDLNFYSNLIEHRQSISKVLQKESLFSDVPSNWHVIITDIKDSTKAIESGRQEVVNLIATGSIIAVLNIAHEAKTTIPFFFGGDGATLIIPPQILEESLNALKEHQQNSFENFDMFLRVGSLAVSEVFENEFRLKIAKAKINDYLSIPIILGAGLQFVESVIKGDENTYQNPELLKNSLNLEGMECRWDRIKPPEELHEILCLLVSAVNRDDQASVYKKVLDKIESIYGSHKKRSPISVAGLRLNATLERINSEMKVKHGSKNLKFLMQRIFATIVGKFYLRYNEEGREYLNSLVELTDTLVLDGRINTVISGLSKQHNELEEYLDELEEAGEISFGMHRCNESIMTCYVRDRKDQHIHFVDGIDGGYTKAASVLKTKFIDN